MVKRLRRPVKRPPDPNPWLVPFDADNRPAIFIHRHQTDNDHSACGPLIFCCEKAYALHQRLWPELSATVVETAVQSASHLIRWFDKGLPAVYFALCDDHDPESLYTFGLRSEPAKALLLGQLEEDRYRRPAFKSSVSSQNPGHEPPDGPANP